jgi:hypothetical protein
LQSTGCDMCNAAPVSAEAEGLTDIKVADWSNEVAPFWAEVRQPARTSSSSSIDCKACQPYSMQGSS